jgi:hypothetical protein
MLNVTGCTNVRIISSNQLPPKRMSYQVWHTVEVTCSYTAKGLPVTAVIQSAVANYYGMNDAMVVGYQAPNFEFQDARSLLSRVSKSIILTNAAEANGNNTLIHPKNHPNTTGDMIMETWEHNQKIRDKTMHEGDLARRGTIDLYDPSTGRTTNEWNQYKNYYWRDGTGKVVGTDTNTPPGPGYTQLQTPPQGH